MSLNEEDIKAVVFYRKEKAYATLREAEDMIETKHWNLAIQRMYYVSKGLLTKEEGRLYSRLLQNRITGDYNDFFDFAEEDVLPLIEPVRKLVKKIEELIDMR